MSNHTEHRLNDLRRGGGEQPSAPSGGAGDAALARIEELLALNACIAPVPTDLAARVFSATVAQLPGAALRIDRAGTTSLAPGAETRLPWRSARVARTLRLTAWSRLGMAAALALAFIIPARLLWTVSNAPGDSLSGNALLVLSRIGPEGDRFVGAAGSGLGSGDTYRDAYLETFGILGAGVDDLLGDVPASSDDAVGG